MHYEKERQRKAKTKDAKRAWEREYNKRPEVMAKRNAYERKRNADPERRAYNKRMRERPEMREKRLAYIRAYNTDPKVQAYKRAYNLKRMYGVELEDLTYLMLVQDGRCAVCERQFNNENKGTKPHVDHDHATGSIRGLLCGPCNILEGFILRLGLTPGDFAERLQAYLDNPPASEIIW